MVGYLQEHFVGIEIRRTLIAEWVRLVSIATMFRTSMLPLVVQLLPPFASLECECIHILHCGVAKWGGSVFGPIAHTFEICLIAQPVSLDCNIVLKKAFLLAQCLLLAIGAVKRVIITEELF